MSVYTIIKIGYVHETEDDFVISAYLPVLRDYGISSSIEFDFLNRHVFHYPKSENDPSTFPIIDVDKHYICVLREYYMYDFKEISFGFYPCETFKETYSKLGL